MAPTFPRKFCSLREKGNDFMRFAAPCLAIVVFFAAAVAPAYAATKVFLLAGQSNMAGVGGYSGYMTPGAEDPWTLYPYGQGPDAACPSPYNTPNSSVKFWNYAPNATSTNFDTNVNSVEVLPGVGNGWVSLQQGYGALKSVPGNLTNYGPQFGPELSFGRRLKELYPNDEIYLVKYALSSTALGDRWSSSGGDCYNTLKTRINAAMANLTAAGKNPAIAGMIWMQGEDDSTIPAYASAYATNLKNLVTSVRTTYNVPSMKFVAGRITYMGQLWGSPQPQLCDLVRNAQWNNPFNISNYSCVNTDDLQWAYYGHYGTQGQIDLGIRFANQFAPVPEPSTLILIAVGAVGMLGYIVRKKQ
jgi:hypothetical protein